MTTLTLARPLPQRSAAPTLDPPYDDERGWGRIEAGTLALALPLPLDLPVRTPLTLVPPTGQRPAPPREDERVPTPREALPDPRPRAVALVRALLEVLAGDRPSRHLALAMTLDVLNRVEQSHRCGSRPWARSLRTLRVAEPTPGTAEVAAVVERGGRCTALALRLEGLDGRWMVTELELG